MPPLSPAQALTPLLSRVSQKPILGFLRLGIGKVRFADSATFNGLRPLKVAMHPYIAEGVGLQCRATSTMNGRNGAHAIALGFPFDTIL